METRNPEGTPESGLEAALAGKIGLLERSVRERFGGEATLAECRALAKETAELTGEPFTRCYAGALWGAQYVEAFRGLDSRSYLRSCPVCEPGDNGRPSGWQVGEDGARPCHSCEEGLALEAGDWLDRIRPIGRGGKRYDSSAGRRAFERAFKHLPTRRERLLARMDEIEHGTKSPRRDSDGKWD